MSDRAYQNGGLRGLPNGSIPQYVRDDDPIFRPDEKFAKTLTIINDLRDFDVEHEFSLPQLVVCGEQSAGKSSVLEAISGVRFPVSGMKCTRFATQINIQPTRQRSDPYSIEVSIQPHQSQSSATSVFNKTIQNLDGLWLLIEDASKKMDVAYVAENGNAEGGQSSFSKDILKIDIRRNDQQPLTLVDLPGIIHSDGPGEQARPNSDKRLVEDIVKKWIGDPNSIILAVVDAIRDIESHAILDLAVKADPRGDRTIGIITKPDKLEVGQKSQENWINIALNNHPHFRFRRGWHILHNRGERDSQNKTALAQRNENERDYFDNAAQNYHGWGKIVHEAATQRKERRSAHTCGWGAEHLKLRLRILLKEQTNKTIPKILGQVRTKLEGLDARLAQIGMSSMNPEKAQEKFQDICDEMANMIEKGVDGHWNHNYPLQNLNPDDLGAGHVSFLRSNINILDREFADKLRARAHNTLFSPDHRDNEPNPEDWTDKVFQILEVTKGTELQTSVDPARISLLFRHYSDGWKQIAEFHVHRVALECQKYLSWVIDEKLQLALPELVLPLRELHALPLLRERTKRALEELKELEKDRKRPVRTDNKFFVDQSQKARHNSTFQMVLRAMECQDASKLNPDIFFDPLYIAESVGISTEEGSRMNSAAQLITDMLIYYRIAVERYIDEVIIHVNERHLLDDLRKILGDVVRNKGNCLEKIWTDERITEITARYTAVENELKQLQLLHDRLAMSS